jgi:methylmalonyl-CoA mutase cobalamin-binding subunit
LRASGVRAIFTPGTPTGEVIDWVRQHVVPRRR